MLSHAGGFCLLGLTAVPAPRSVLTRRHFIDVAHRERARGARARVAFAAAICSRPRARCGAAKRVARAGESNFYAGHCRYIGLLLGAVGVLLILRARLRHPWNGLRLTALLYQVARSRNLAQLRVHGKQGAARGPPPETSLHTIYLSQVRHRPPTLSVVRGHDGVDEPQPLERARQERRQVQRPRRRQMAVVH